MGLSVDFITDRALKTLSAAGQVEEDWVSQEVPTDALRAAHVAIVGDATVHIPVVGQEAVASQKEQAMKGARGVWETALDQLHRWTVQGVGMARTRFRNDPAKLAVMSGLSASSNSHQETLDEALAWESAWTTLDPAWAPLPANTLTAFKALRAQCDGALRTAYTNARSAWRKEAEKLSAMARDLEDLNEAWYADATKVFTVGSPQGDMIRSTVPTTYSPPPDKPPQQGTTPPPATT